MKHFISFLIIACLTGCSANEFISSQPDQPRIILAGGTGTDIVWIDNINIGTVNNFQKPNISAIPISIGKHTLKIIRDESVVYEETFYIDGNLTKEININN